MHRLIATLACVLTLGTGTVATADPGAPTPAPTTDLPPAAATSSPAPSFAHLNSPREACTLTTTPSCVLLAPGYYLDESAWATRDAELKRLQDAETRLAAENQSLRGALDGWQPGWKTLVLTLASGLALGAYLDHAL